MTISAQDARIIYQGSGSTGPFAVAKDGNPIIFKSNSHIKVRKLDADGVETLLVESTHYTLTGGPTNGQVTLVTALAIGEFIAIYREQPLDQSTALQVADPFSSANVELQYDKFALQLQELKDQIDRAIKVTRTSALATDVTEIPEITVTPDSDTMVFIQEGAGARQRTAQEKMREAFSITDFDGIDPTGDDDCTSAVQSAFNQAILAGHRTVLAPPGEYFFDGDSDPLDPGTGITLIGAGGGRTIFVFDEETSGGSDHWLIKNTDGASGKVHMEIRGIEFRGTMFNGTGQKGDRAIWLESYPSVMIVDNVFEGIGCLGAFTWKCDKVTFKGNRVRNLGRGGLHSEGGTRTYYLNNRFELTGDDPISCHVFDVDLVSETVGQNEGVLIQGNIARCCAGSFKALGSRFIDISHNRMQLTHGIIFGNTSESGTGRQNGFNVNVSDNILLDTVRMESGGIAATQVIGWYAAAPQGSAATHSTPPFLWDSTDSAFIYPWNHRNTESSDATDAVAPDYNIKIHNNVIGRTLPAVANVASYNFGTPNFQGTSLTTNMTDAILRPSIGINAAGVGSINLGVNDNNIMHATSAFQLTHNKTARNVKLSGNSVFDCISTGVTWASQPVSQETFDCTISDNVFDLDPFRQNANSNTDGTYDANGSPLIFNSGANIAGMHIHGNRFINACQIMNATGMALQNWHDNIAFIDPTAIGFSASNQGIGNIPNEPGIELAVIDGDPTSVTYFQSFQRLLRASPTMPSSGWYPVGWVVYDISPSATSIGWIRLTTGTGHVDGTDWVAFGTVRGPSSAPTDGHAVLFDGVTGRLLKSAGFAPAKSAMRVHTAAGAVTVDTLDDVVVVNKTVGAATTANLPATPTSNQRHTIKDGKGDAATNPITITPNSGNIDGAATYIMNFNYQSVDLIYNGTEWSII